MSAARPTRAEAAQYAASAAYGRALDAWERARDHVVAASSYWREDDSYQRAAFDAYYRAAGECTRARLELLAWQTGKAKP